MLEVCKERCAQCLFSKEKIVSDARRRDILAKCKQDDSYFVCHKTDNACCRGFYDTRSTNYLRIAQRLNAVKFVEVPA